VYWTTPEDIRRLFTESIPDTARKWSKQRVMLYLHGGLNSEEEVARRVIAFRDVCLENEIYPLHIMWETGAMETLKDILRDALGLDDRASGWLKSFRDHIAEAKDRTFELTVSRPGTAMWDEMKENARLASARPDQRGAMQVLVAEARKALSKLSAADRRNWELHIVGHSAGSIFAAYALDEIMKLGVGFKSVSFMAPAISVRLFKDRMLGPIKSDDCPKPSLFVLSDEGERDDDVGPYGKSLLYLVSNAFEGHRDSPLLGMQRFIQQLPGQPVPDRDLARLFSPAPGARPSVVIAGAGGDADSQSKSDSHGGFDNDEWTLNSILNRILGHAPPRPFSARDLQY